MRSAGKWDVEGMKRVRERARELQAQLRDDRLRQLWLDLGETPVPHAESSARAPGGAAAADSAGRCSIPMGSHPVE